MGFKGVYITRTCFHDEIKVLCKKIFLDRVFSIVKLPVREVTFFTEKSKLIIFHHKRTKPKQNCFVCIAERHTLKIIPQICLIFSLRCLDYLPCTCKILFKMIFGRHCFISELIFKLFVALFRTHELQKDGMVIFYLWRFRKVRFRKMQFLKDGVQTVGNPFTRQASH